MRDTRSYDQKKMDAAREQEDPINDRSDFPPEQPRRRCVGQCTPSRDGLTTANNAMSAVSGATDFLLGLINPAKLGYQDPDAANDWNNSIADRKRAGEAAYQEQQRLIAASKARDGENNALLLQCTPEERAIFQTHLEANALRPGQDTLTPMGLGRDNSGRVVRQGEPARRLR